jgi:hypothetical protein
MVAPMGRESATFTLFALDGGATTAGVLRGGAASRCGVAAAIAADCARSLAARALSGFTLEAGATPAPGAAFKLSGGVGVRCADGISGAGRGGGGELGGNFSAGAGAATSGVGVVTDCAAAACATPTRIMSAASRGLVMVSPSSCCCTQCSSWR